MYHVLMHEEPLENVIEPTDVRNLFVAPASLDLAGAEIELVPAFSREQRLKRAIDAVLSDYDYVLIDCPPSLGLLTVNGLAAASEVMVPIQCEYYALEGLGQLLRNVDLVKRNLNPTLDLSTILCVMYDARTKLSGQVVSEVREHFGDKVLKSVIPRSVRLSEAPSFGQPITTFDPTSRGAIAYRDAAREVHMARSSGLGKGLSSIIPTAERPDSDASLAAVLADIAVSAVSPNPTSLVCISTRRASRNSRRRSPRWASSSRSSFVRSDEETYELIAGERRWRAAQRAGLTTIPAVIRTTDDASRSSRRWWRTCIVRI